MGWRFHRISARYVRFRASRLYCEEEEREIQSWSLGEEVGCLGNDRFH